MFMKKSLQILRRTFLILFFNVQNCFLKENQKWNFSKSLLQIWGETIAASEDGTFTNVTGQGCEWHSCRPDWRLHEPRVWNKKEICVFRPDKFTMRSLLDNPEVYRTEHCLKCNFVFKTTHLCVNWKLFQELWPALRSINLYTRVDWPNLDKNLCELFV